MRRTVPTLIAISSMSCCVCSFSEEGGSIQGMRRGMAMPKKREELMTPVRANATFPLRNPVMTGAAVAVGVMAIKNPIRARSFCSERKRIAQTRSAPMMLARVR